MSEAQPVSTPNAADDARHTIRLHGPWRVEPLVFPKRWSDDASVDLTGELPAARVVTFPAPWETLVGLGFRGRVLCKRRFGRPTNVGVNERIELVVQPIQGLVAITLNGTAVGEMRSSEAALRFDVTNVLLVRNELHIEINRPAVRDDGAVGGNIGEVQLEIYESGP